MSLSNHRHSMYKMAWRHYSHFHYLKFSQCENNALFSFYLIQSIKSEMSRLKIEQTMTLLPSRHIWNEQVTNTGMLGKWFKLMDIYFQFLEEYFVIFRNISNNKSLMYGLQNFLWGAAKFSLPHPNSCLPFKWAVIQRTEHLKF